jgi:hypothetical protein
MRKTLVCGLLLVAIVSVGQAEVIYRETFPYVSNIVVPTEMVGLERALRAAGQGWYTTQANRSANNHGIVSDSTGDDLGGPLDGLNNLPNLPLDGQGNDAFQRGRIFASAKHEAGTAYWTHEAAIDTAAFKAIRLVMRNGAKDDFHALIQVGGQWYVSDEYTEMPDDTDADGWGETFIVLDDPMWATADVSLPGITGETGTATLTSGFDFDTPSGLITGFGLYNPSLDGNQRIDIYEVNNQPIPEPATMSLLALGGLVALRRRRR